VASSQTWLDHDHRGDHSFAQATRWLQVGLLDIGEAEAIALARQLNANWFLTDDAVARVLATSLGLEVHGS
jgi:predicted nucleic acid-binding protein